jgi:hypothetical protein
MEWAWTSADNEADRQAQLAASRIAADSSNQSAKIKGEYETSAAVGGFIGDVIKLGLTGKIF